VVLTGAGASTESGLPDFRSPGGLWAGVNPARVASLSAFRRDPEAFFAFYRARLETLEHAAPNRAHRAIATLEARGHVQMIITQNVDGLHQQAGSREVVEVHGNLREARCAECGRIVSIAEMRAGLDPGAVPRCRWCGGVLRPNLVLFEELLPVDAYTRAEEAVRHCDVLLVVGSSLEVYPVAALPDLAVQQKARLVIVNRESTPYDPVAEVVLRGTAGPVLSQIVAALDEAGEDSGDR
jgi:NAD-dependent protein deacetylase/lipoamidase